MGELSRLLIWHAENGKSTVIHIHSFEALERRHGTRVRDLVEAEYSVLDGAATAEEKKIEMASAKDLCSDLALRASSTDTVLAAGRSRAYRQADADKRDLDSLTLRTWLTRAIYREALIQGCEAEGLDRRAAEDLVVQERDAEKDENGAAHIDDVSRRLLAKIGEIMGLDPTGGPLDTTIKRLGVARSRG